MARSVARPAYRGAQATVRPALEFCPPLYGFSQSQYNFVSQRIGIPRPVGTPVQVPAGRFAVHINKKSYSKQYFI